MNVRHGVFALAMACVMAVPSSTWADDTTTPATEKPATGTIAAETPAGSSAGAAGGSATPQPPTPAHVALLKDAKPVSGMLTMYEKGNNLYAELAGGDYTSEYIVLISISRGIGQTPLLGGFSWGFGDDWIWQFRKVGENVHIVRRNVRFKANTGSPEARAVQNAYTDSVLFSLPIITKGPKGGDMVDLTQVFMSDLPQIGQVLQGFIFSPQKSSIAEAKGFPNNMELEIAATYASSGQMEIDTVPDSRGVTINVHYSISKIPTTGYTPRLADDRVGYFLTAVKDFSSKSDRDQFVRYVNRWNLTKADASAEISPPQQPIKFWIEKTVPYKFRKPIYDGIYEWNKAFEAAGFVNALIVDQQPDNAEWDPEDVNYNTFRWITSNAGFAMGPSRVNPYTGQILDADIIFDADFLSFWKEEYENLTPQTIAEMTGGALDIDSNIAPRQRSIFNPRATTAAMDKCMLNRGMSMQLAFGAAAIQAQADPKMTAEQLEKFIMQALKEVTMHEVGHTLGLRHNFKASKWLSLKEQNDPEKTKTGMVASVMDYNPANIVPKEWKQGDYFTSTLGPYDMWAIEYGYKQLSGGTLGEVAELKKIAARSGEKALQYATDEDTRGTDPDPDSNRFDNGSDPIEFAKMRGQILKELLPGLVDRTTKEGDDYTQARRTFNILVSQYGQSMFFLSRYVGGLSTSRSHKGDKDGRMPVVLVDVKLQRDALAMLEEDVFGAKELAFSPELYNQLGWTNWSHWGVSEPTRKDFGVHDFVLQWQSRMLDQMLSSVTLRRMHDAELKAPADQDVLTTAELLERLTKAIYSEVDTVKNGEFTPRKPAISSIRRNLQREYLSRLGYLAMGDTAAPADCQTVAYAQLTDLKNRVKVLLESNDVKLDSYTRAHLLETSSRIEKILDARLTLSAP